VKIVRSRTRPSQTLPFDRVRSWRFRQLAMLKEQFCSSGFVDVGRAFKARGDPQAGRVGGRTRATKSVSVATAKARRARILAASRSF